MACVINVIGDLVLVAGLHLDAAGAAIATVLAQAVSVILAVYILKNRQLSFEISKKNFRINKQCKRFLIIGLTQTLLVRLPLAYFMSIQPDARLTNIGLSAPIATCFGIVLNVLYFVYMQKTI